MFTESYERKLKGNSLIFTENSEEKEDDDFEERMITENPIRGFISCGVRINNGNKQFVYDITSKQSYEMLYEEKELRGIDLRKLISGIINMRSELSEYLLSDSNVVLDPKYLYTDPESKNPYFIFYPYYNHDIKESLMELGMFLLERTNHKDEEAVSLAYGFYKYIVNENYAFEKLLTGNPIENDSEEEDKDEVKDEANKGHELNNKPEPTYINYKETEKNKSDYIERTVLLICTSILILMILLVTGIKYRKLENILFVSNRKLIGIICMLSTISIAAPIALLINKAGNRNKRLRYDSISKEIAEEESKKRDRLLNQKSSLGKTEEIGEEGKIKYRLVCYDEEEIREIVIDKLPFTIGKSREDVDKCLSYREISRIHARFFYKSGQIYIMDCNSTNGTSVNGRMLAANESARLQENDEISLGGRVFYFR